MLELSRWSLPTSGQVPTHLRTSVHSEAEEEEQAAAVVFVSAEEFEEQIQEGVGQQTEDGAQQPRRHRGAGETQQREGERGGA